MSLLASHQGTLRVTRKLPHFKELDGLRGFAAIYIFFHHVFQIHPQGLAEAPALMKGVAFVMSLGYSAVDLFFVLSGFLITSLMLINRSKPNFFHDFYWKRVLRIQPAFFVYLAWLYFSGGAPAKYLVICLFFLANYADSFGVSIASVAWSLAIEEHFYLFWPQVVYRLRVKTIARVSLGVFVFSTCMRVVVMAWKGGFNIQHTLFRLDGLGLGALAACAYVFPEELSRDVWWAIRLLKSRTLLVCLFAGVALLPLLAHSKWEEPAVFSLTTLLAYRLISAIGSGRKFPILKTPALLFMGRISYGFYLYHSLSIAYVWKHFSSSACDGRFAEQIMLELAMAMAISTISFYGIERPAQSLRRYVLAK